MKRIFNLIIVLIILTLGLSSDAQVLTATKIKNDVSNEIVKTYKKYTDADLEVVILSVPFAELKLPEGQITYKVTSNTDRFMARDVKKVDVLVNGNFAKTFVLPVAVKAYKNILVARSFIDRESTVTAQNTRIERREVSNNIDYVITSDKLSRDLQTKKFFKENEVIDKRFVKMRPDVSRNQEVVATFQSNEIVISISATSLSDGMVGDYVILQSPKYQKNYRGKVIGQNKVLVNI